jgi:16S rRNA G966 N2-methylase RsmD
MDDAEATAFMLADNRTSDLGGYDDNLLAAILAEEAAADNLAATGYDEDAVAALIRAAGMAASPRDPEAVPDRPSPAEVYVKLGDLWGLGRHRLLVGDATDPAAVGRLTAGSTVDLLWTDPPYGVDYTGKTAAALKIENDNLGAEGTRALVADALRLAPLRPGAAFYLTAPAGPLHLAFLLALADADLSVRQALVC